MFPELNKILSFNKKFLAVAQLPDRFLLRGFQAGLQIVRLRGITQFVQLLNDRPHFVDHQVGSRANAPDRSDPVPEFWP